MDLNLICNLVETKEEKEARKKKRKKLEKINKQVKNLEKQMVNKNFSGKKKRKTDEKINGFQAIKEQLVAELGSISEN